MTLDLKKKELELMKVNCAKAEMQMKIFEAHENIKRLEENIIVQDDRIKELEKEINELKK